MVTFLDTATGKDISYSVDKKMQIYLDRKVKIDLAKKDKDYPLLIDGYEGAGKSTFAQQIGKYVDPSLDLSRICMTADEFKAAVNIAQKNQCVIYDEAVTGMTAADSLSRVGKLLKSMMMQMRQKNLFIIIILPSVFEFNKYSVLSRAKAFFHVYEHRGIRGYFAGYNRRDLRRIYLEGKKTYSYKVRSHFKGRFYGKYVVNEEEYRAKKAQALALIGDDAKEETGNKKYIYQRDFLINYLVFNKILSVKDIETVYSTAKYPIKERSLYECVEKMR